VLQDIRAMGGKILDIGEAGAGMELGSGLEEAIRNVLYLPVGQVIAFERSISKGLDPDRPTNLSKVVMLD
jgi:glucosamine--fructose-6-phosphate aminotransferase (isomerizing)